MHHTHTIKTIQFLVVIVISLVSASVFATMSSDGSTNVPPQPTPRGVVTNELASSVSILTPRDSEKDTPTETLARVCEKHYSHFNVEQALQFVEKVNPKHAYLTHSSHHMGLYADVEKTLPPHVTLGYDGLQFTVGK